MQSFVPLLLPLSRAHTHCWCDGALMPCHPLFPSPLKHPPPSPSTHTHTPTSCAALRPALQVLVCAVLHLQPLLRPLSATGYTWALRFAMAASLISIYQQHGFPNRSQGWSGLQAWAMPALSSPEFLAFTTQMVYASMTPLGIALVPSCIAAAYAVSAYGAQHHVTHPLWVRYGGRVRAWLLERQVRHLGGWVGGCDVGVWVCGWASGWGWGDGGSGGGWRVGGLHGWVGAWVRVALKGGWGG
jgi:hypothetical protein